MRMALWVYLPIVVIADQHRPTWRLAGLVLVLLPLRPRLFLRIDWSLLAVFALMFVDLRLLAAMSSLRSAAAALDLGNSRHLYVGGVLLSRPLNNVPAVALRETSARRERTPGQPWGQGRIHPL